MPEPFVCRDRHRVGPGDNGSSILGISRRAQTARTRCPGLCYTPPPLATPGHGNDIVFVTSSGSVKARNLRRNPLASFTVDDPNPPYTFVNVEGPVTISDDTDLVRHWAEKFAARYMGAEFAKGFVQMEGFPDDRVYRLTPTHMTGLANLMEQ